VSAEPTIAPQSSIAEACWVRPSTRERRGRGRREDKGELEAAAMGHDGRG
jgi:hypothetical protein